MSMRQDAMTDAIDAAMEEATAKSPLNRAISAVAETVKALGGRTPVSDSLSRRPGRRRLSRTFGGRRSWR